MKFNSSEKGIKLFAVQVCCIVFVYLTGGLRWYVKAGILGSHEWDDKFMYLSVFLYTAQSTFVFRGLIEGGLGQHIVDLTRHQIVVSFQSWYFGELIYALVSITVRISVGLMLLRIYDRAQHRRLYKTLLYTCLGVVIFTSVVFFFASLFQCSPPEHYWRQFEEDASVGACSNNIVPTTAIVLSVVASISDWVLALFPMISLWNTRVPWSTKAKILILMSLGVFAGVVMIIRIFYINKLEITEDFIYKTVDVAMWTILEPALGIIAGCLPTLPKLFRKRQRQSATSCSLPSYTATDNEKLGAMAFCSKGDLRSIKGDDIYVEKTVEVRSSR